MIFFTNITMYDIIALTVWSLIWRFLAATSLASFLLYTSAFNIHIPHYTSLWAKVFQYNDKDVRHNILSSLYGHVHVVHDHHNIYSSGYDKTRSLKFEAHNWGDLKNTGNLIDTWSWSKNKAWEAINSCCSFIYSSVGNDGEFFFFFAKLLLR